MTDAPDNRNLSLAAFMLWKFRKRAVERTAPALQRRRSDDV